MSRYRYIAHVREQELDVFQKMLKKHDWYWTFKEADSESYNEGKQERVEIEEVLCNHLEDDAFERMFNEYRQY